MIALKGASVILRNEDGSILRSFVRRGSRRPAPTPLRSRLTVLVGSVAVTGCLGGIAGDLADTIERRTGPLSTDRRIIDIRPGLSYREDTLFNELTCSA